MEGPAMGSRTLGWKVPFSERECAGAGQNLLCALRFLKL